MSIQASGHLAKMDVQLAELVQYQLPLDDQRIPLNDLIGSNIAIEHVGDIHCIHCGRRSKKSFSQGYCYPCFTKLPQCDTCIMSPERCHFHHGTCRDPEWGEKYCFTDHFVYLANSSGVKVGITRGTQLPTRWIDQGATQGLPIFRVQTRYQAGLIEDCIREHVADKTSWQKMLKGDAEPVELATIRDELMAKSESGLELLEQEFGLQALQRLYSETTTEINFPVREFPEKVKSFNLDKQPLVEGLLKGIKGQYLILDSGVINIRKYTGYNVRFSAS
ncbi:MAG: DUF2797 domain-containing protein [Porticoccaceae bacterium]|jgi:hypothetical protein|nr:DUF2797 domain-containing protein [Porticoccaceae bacterium]MDG1484701.1 DUF2797 domain-containing protein [Porticoccaceae bacterium]